MAETIKQQIEEIKTLPDRSLAYASLLQLHRLSANDPSSMESLSLSSPPLIPILLSDIHHQDEESAAQALKCLGFMLYHPSLVPIFSEGVAELVLDSLAKLIMTTRMKAICNFGVWCISIQQLGAGFVESRIDLLLGAVIHALDNPFGSLSTTFEAIQAVTKLAAQFCEKMRDNSNIWVPPIYRRLISNDKRERDMAERCLLKTKSIICPPTLILSKVVMLDLKKKLLPSILDILHDHRQKVHMIQAWGWFICLLGSFSLKNRNLINEMLKIPEQTFTDPDSQVQIASLVAWEHLVDALLPPQKINLETNCDDQVNGLLRRIKVLITPLQGIISSKCDISVRSSCLKTWHYLLYRLDLSVNHPSVIRTVFWPILEVIFSKGLDNIENICLWTLCLDLLDDYILSKVEAGEMELSAEKSPCCLVNKTATARSFVNSKISSKDYPVKWLPWKVCNLDFHLKMVGIILSQGLVMTVIPENRKLAFSSALRIFRSVLQGVQVELKMLSTHYDRIQFFITTIFKFTKEVCEDIASKHSANQCNDFLWIALQFVEAIREELDSSILASPLYRVSLDLKYIKDIQLSENTGYMKVDSLGIGSLVYMDMITPVVYTTILHLCLMAQSVLNLSILEKEGIPRAMQHSKFMLFSANPLVNLNAAISFLYMLVGNPVNGRFHWFMMWRIIAKGLKEFIGSVNGLSFSKTECDNASCTVVYWFLCHPLLMLLYPMKVSAPKSVGSCSDLCLVSSQRETELELVIEVWKAVFDSLHCGSQSESSSMNNYGEGLSQMLIRVLDENSAMVMQDSIKSSLEKSQKFDFLLIFGELVICILKHTQVLDTGTLGSEVINQEGNCQNQCSPIKNSLGLVARFLGLSVKFVKTNPQAEHVIVCRVFAAMTCLVGHICAKQDLLLLMESISDSLVQWLSWCTSISGEMQQGRSTIYQLQCFWTHTLDCLQRSQPPIIFDSFYLGVQASLLETSLDHPHPPISDSTIAFWKATYAQNVDLHYPRCLLPVLDKLSRSGRISLRRESPGILVNNSSSAKKVTGLSQKRILEVDITEEPVTNRGCVDIVTVGLRRKRLKMVKHTRKSKGVKSIHGHGPGMFEYFEGKQELRKADYILEMLRKAK